MNSVSVAAGASVSTPSTGKKVKRHCIGKVGAARNPCGQTVTWFVEKIGNMCNPHFQHYFDQHWQSVPVDSIRRLSDDEVDFSVPSREKLAGGRPKKHVDDAPDDTSADI